METITLTGGNNTVPNCTGANAVVVIRGKTKMTGLLLLLLCKLITEAEMSKSVHFLSMLR